MFAERVGMREVPIKRLVSSHVPPISLENWITNMFDLLKAFLNENQKFLKFLKVKSFFKMPTSIKNKANYKVNIIFNSIKD